MVAAGPGSYGKPRPALVMQSDFFDALASLTVLPLTSTLVDLPLLRVPVEPTPENGLRQPSQVMVDKVFTVRRASLGPRIGRLEGGALSLVDAALARFLGLA